MTPEITKLVIFPYINYFIFLAIVVFAARKPLGEYFSNLFNSFHKETKDAKLAFEKANKTHEETLARLDNLDKEIVAMKESAEKSSALEVKKITKHAEDLSIHLSKETKRIAEAEMNQATAALRKEMIQSVMTTVESSISKKIGAGDQDKILESAIKKLKELKQSKRV